MIKFEKGFFLKITAVCVCFCFIADISVYSAPNLRPSLLFNENSKKAGEKRFKAVGSNINRKDSPETVTFKKTKPTETNRRSTEFLKKLLWYRANLDPKQKEATSKIISIYRNAYNLNLDKEKEERIINKILLVKYSKRPIIIYFYLMQIWSLFGVTVSSYNLIFAQDYLNAFKYTIFYTAMSTITMYVIKYIKSHIKDVGGSMDTFLHKISLSFDTFKQDSSDINFLIAISHELAHYFNFPNNCLLANAYAFFAAYSFDKQQLDKVIDHVKNIQEYDDILKEGREEPAFYIKELILADEILKIIPEAVSREATLRKILSNGIFRRQFEECSNRAQIRELIQKIYADIDENDYRLPHYIGDTFHPWVYEYGEAIAYIAMQSCYDTENALQYIYKLGQAKDSRELAGFNFNFAGDNMERITFSPIGLREKARGAIYRLLGKIRAVRVNL